MTVGQQPGKVKLPKMSLAGVNSEILGSKTLLGFSCSKTLLFGLREATGSNTGKQSWKARPGSKTTFGATPTPLGKQWEAILGSKAGKQSREAKQLLSLPHSGPGTSYYLK